MKIVLINPAWTDTLGSFAAIGRERLYAPPLGLCYLAASVLKAGHEAEIIDAETANLQAPAVAAIVREKAPDIVGINVFSPTLHKSKEVALEIRKALPGVPIVIGGAHVSILKEEALLDCYDYGIVHEGDEALIELMAALAARRDPADIKGLIYRRDGRITVNPFRAKIQNIDLLPFPALQLLDTEKYVLRFANGKKTRYMSMLAMRGCPFQCVFCSEPVMEDRTVRYRSPANVVDELERDYREFNIPHFTFADSNITLNRAQALGIAEEIIRRKLPITWEGWTRANLVDEELLRAMRDSGFNRISFGVESGDPEVLKIIKKEVPLEAMEKAFRLCNKLGIEVSCSVMLGLPGETRESINRTIEFVRKAPILFSNFSIAIPYPGTEMLEMAKRGEHGLRLLEPDYTKWTRYGAGPMAVNDLQPEDLVRLQKVGLLKIHLTPIRILTSLRIIKFSVLLPMFWKMLLAVLTGWKQLLRGARKK